MDSGMSSAETLPRVSSDEELSQDSSSFNDEKIIDKVYVTEQKEKNYKKSIRLIIFVTLIILLLLIVCLSLGLANRNISAYKGNIIYNHCN